MRLAARAALPPTIWPMHRCWQRAAVQSLLHPAAAGRGVYNSLLIAADLRKKTADQKRLETARVDSDGPVQSPHGDGRLGRRVAHFNGSVRQSLIMMNGELMDSAVSSTNGTFVKSVQQSNLKLEEKVEHLFLAALSRQPSKRKQEAVRRSLPKTATTRPLL